MGYYTRIHGSITIEGAFLDQATLNNRGWNTDGDGYFALQSETQGDTVAVINGAITVVPGIKRQVFDFRFDDDGKFYDIEEQCAEIARCAVAAGAKITGTLRGMGEESLDVWRIVFDGKQPNREVPKMVWPDGTTESLR